MCVCVCVCVCQNDCVCFVWGWHPDPGFRFHKSWHFCRAIPNPELLIHGFEFHSGQVMSLTPYLCVYACLCTGDATLCVETPGQCVEGRVPDPLLYLQSAALVGFSHCKCAPCCHIRNITLSACNLMKENWLIFTLKMNIFERTFLVYFQPNYQFTAGLQLLYTFKRAVFLFRYLD